MGITFVQLFPSHNSDSIKTIESAGEPKLEEEQTMAQQATGLASQGGEGEPDRQLIVIVGGGFAAVQFAKTLRKKLPASECDILLIPPVCVRSLFTRSSPSFSKRSKRAFLAVSSRGVMDGLTSGGLISRVRVCR
jgi:hypothetical protein